MASVDVRTYWICAGASKWNRNLALAGMLPIGIGGAYRGTGWKGRWLGASSTWNVVPGRRCGANIANRNVSVWDCRTIVEEKRTAICPFLDSGSFSRAMDRKMKRYKKKGRFVLEAAILVPGICLLLVALVYFTLYAHDYAVCIHAALESGTKGIYREGDSNAAMEQKICQDLKEKLNHRLLWIKEPEIQVQISPVKATIRINGQGDFLKECSVNVIQEIQRIRPCTTIRKSRWLTGKGKT